MSRYYGVKLREDDIRILEKLESILGMPIDQGSAKYRDKITILDEKSEYRLDKALPSQIGEIKTSEPIASYLNDGSKVIGIELDNFSPEIIKQCITLFPEFKKTEHVILQQNGLSELPEEISQLKKLLELNLSGNNKVQIPESTIEGLSKLEKIDLSNNNLESIPSAIFSFSKLVYLNLANNFLQSIDEDIRFLTKLEILNLRNNKLQQLPTGIKELTKLETLNLRENQLTRLPSQIRELTKLISFDISQNQLKRLPLGITELSSLKTFKLHHNNFQRFDDKTWSFLAELDQKEGSNIRLFPNPIEYNSYVETYRKIEAEAKKETIEFLEKYSDSILEEKDFERFVLREEDEYHLDSILNNIDNASPPQLSFAQNEVTEAHQEDLSIASLIAKALYGTFLGAGITKVIVGLEEITISDINMSVFFVSILLLLSLIHIFYYRAIQKEKLLEYIDSKLLHHHMELLNLQPVDFEQRVDQARRSEVTLLRNRFRSYLTFAVNFFFSTTAIFLATLSLTKAGSDIFGSFNDLVQLLVKPLNMIEIFWDYISTNIFEMGILALFILVMVFMILIYLDHPRYRAKKRNTYETLKDKYWQKYKT